MAIVTVLQAASQTHAASHPLVRLAAAAIDTFLVERRVLEPAADFYAAMPEALKPAGAFVCLKRQGELRGCIGTTEPRCETLAIEVIKNAIASASRDPRFPPVEASELLELSIGVYVLGASESIADPAELDPRRYGLIVSAGARQSVLLPGLEEILTVEAQLAAARKKAGIGPEEPVTLRRFEIVRYR
jgi:MEMO1 family protein